ncbi:MAG: hypothetical protein ACI9WU_004074 [Myxococcota bacterium]|jgi:hypothetical protein
MGSLALIALAALLPQQDAYLEVHPLSDPERLVTSGTAVPGGDSVVLTGDSRHQAGGVFWGCPITLNDKTQITVTLTIQIDGHLGTKGADGIALVLQAAPGGAQAIGASGGALAFGGLAPGLAIELDTWHNPPLDPNDNHVAILSSGHNGAHAQMDAPVDLNGGEIITVVVWIGPDGVMVTFPGYPQFDLRTTVTAGSVLGVRGFLGVVASTGLYSNRHRLLDWQIVLVGQQDTDKDGALDECDDDDDGDGIADENDGCPQAADPDQEDRDGDGIGDACDEFPDDGADADPDEDGLTNAEEASAGTDPSNPDSDGDSIADSDEAPGGARVDTDRDGFPDARDSDSDGDGLLDLAEAGDADWRTPPIDTDGDGVPDFLQSGKSEPEEESGEEPEEGAGAAGGHAGSVGASGGRPPRPGARRADGGTEYIDPSMRPAAPGQAPPTVALHRPTQPSTEAGGLERPAASSGKAERGAADIGQAADQRPEAGPPGGHAPTRRSTPVTPKRSDRVGSDGDNDNRDGGDDDRPAQDTGLPWVPLGLGMLALAGIAGLLIRRAATR